MGRGEVGINGSTILEMVKGALSRIRSASVY
jgi:hypothetical protein